jgi:hypothetical protein
LWASIERPANPISPNLPPFPPRANKINWLGPAPVKVKLTIGFALIAMLVKLPLLLSLRRCSPGCRRGDDTQVASNGLGVVREGWGCHPGDPRETADQVRAGLLRTRPILDFIDFFWFSGWRTRLEPRTGQF